MAAPPLIRDIAKHPVLSKVHLIAEPWDLGMYQVNPELLGDTAVLSDYFIGRCGVDILSPHALATICTHTIVN